MKLIFLDIDGVLNSDLWYQKQKDKEKTTFAYHLDPHCILQLNKIITKTGAKIVISSNWRKRYSQEKLTKAFEQVGFEGEIISMTPNLTSGNKDMIRGNEILKWCRENEATIGCRYVDYKTYAILDDNSDMLYWHRNHFFQTDRYCGLTPTKAAEIIRHLT